MQIHHISDNNSVLNHFLAEIRNIKIQNDSLRFRRNIERIGEIMAYELSKTLEFKAASIQTPLGLKTTSLLEKQLVLCAILRAAVPMHNGFLNYFDHAENGFISAFRHHPKNDSDFEIVVQYEAVADINNKIVVLIDPMLATGKSIVAVYNRIIERGNPSEIHIAVAIAAPEGIAHLQENLPENCHLWIAAIDEALNEKNYIVPGLGDAGDLAFGEKL